MTRLLNPNDPNVVMLELVARRLGADLCDRFAFVGGAVAGLLIADPANPSIRPTEDVDIVAEVLALSGYHRIEKTLRERGFAQDMSADAPICRWKVDGVTVDVMPTLETILGFANRWYPLCVATAAPLALPSGTVIRVIQAPVFIGTKLEAFHGRGGGDYLFSHDLGDIISVVDGRDSLVKDCEQMPAARSGPRSPPASPLHPQLQKQPGQHKQRPHQQILQVFKKRGLFAFDVVADELENP